MKEKERERRQKRGFDLCFQSFPICPLGLENRAVQYNSFFGSGPTFLDHWSSRGGSSCPLSLLALLMFLNIHLRLMLLGAAFGPVSLGHESLHRGPEDVMKLQSEPKNPQRST